MLFADSLEHLLNVPPALVGEQIQAWVAAQYRRSASLPISDYLFHAAKKVHLIKELQLVPKDHIETFLTTFVATLLHICPPLDRPHLQDVLAHLHDSQTVLAATVDVVHQRVAEGADGSAMAAVLRSSTRAAASQTPPPATAPAPPVSPAVARGVRRFELLLQRLASQPALSSATPATAVLAEAVAEAVGGAASSDELLQKLSGLDRLGANAAPRQLLRLLGSRLPDWAPPPSAHPPGRPRRGSAPPRLQHFAGGCRRLHRRPLAAGAQPPFPAAPHTPTRRPPPRGRPRRARTALPARGSPGRGARGAGGARSDSYPPR